MSARHAAALNQFLRQFRGPDLKAVLEELPKATRAALSCEGFSHVTVPSEPAESASEADFDLFMDAMQSALRSHGITVPPPSILKQRNFWKKLNGSWEEVDRWLRPHLKRMPRVSRRAFYEECIESLLTLMGSWNVAITLKSVIYNVDKIPVALDHSFPDYARCGLLHWIVR